MNAVPRSLVWTTDIDVLPVDRVVQRRDGYLVVRSPSNPAHFWGNFLLFDEPPREGDGPRWEHLFERELSGLSHRAFAWDRLDGALGAAREELAARGYEVERTVGLAAAPAELRPHPRANTETTVRALDPEADERLWAAVLEVQVAGSGERFTEAEYRPFARRRLEDLRALFRDGRGAWYVALLDGRVAGSCGIVVTGRRGRFQLVDTVAAYRRRGICSRLVVEAAWDAAERHGAERLVIAAEAEYHALGIYESLGFRRSERVSGAFRTPTS